VLGDALELVAEHLRGPTLDDEVELADRQRDRAARVAGEVAAASRAGPGDEIEVVVEPVAPTAFMWGRPSASAVVIQVEWRPGSPCCEPGPWSKPASRRARTASQSIGGTPWLVRFFVLMAFSPPGVRVVVTLSTNGEPPIRRQMPNSWRSG